MGDSEAPGSSLSHSRGDGWDSGSAELCCHAKSTDVAKRKVVTALGSRCQSVVDEPLVTQICKLSSKETVSRSVLIERLRTMNGANGSLSRTLIGGAP